MNQISTTQPPSSKPAPSKPAASKPTPSKPTQSKPPQSKPTQSKPTSSRPAPKKLQPVRQGRGTPKDKSRLSREARNPEKPATQVPDFGQAFPTAAKVALQGRVIAGQAAGSNGGPQTGVQRVGVRTLGSLGGAGAAYLAAKNGSDLLDSSKSAKDRTLAGLSGAANGAHALHGASQATDLGRSAFKLTPLNKPAEKGAASLGEWGARLGKGVEQVAAARPGELAAKAAQGLTVGSPVSHLAEAGKVTQAAGRVAQVAGRAAPLLGGVAQVAAGGTDLVQNGASFDNVSTAISGGAKLVGAGLIASGLGAPVGAVLIGASTAFDLGKLAWDHRAAIGNALHSALQSFG